MCKCNCSERWKEEIRLAIREVKSDLIQTMQIMELKAEVANLKAAVERLKDNK